MNTREIKRSLAVYIFVAMVFFLFGLKVNWWDSAARIKYDCDNFLMFSVEENGNQIDFGCYRLTGANNHGRD